MRLNTFAGRSALAAVAVVAAVSVAGTASAQSSIRAGQTVNGTLSSTDTVALDGSYMDCYLLSTQSGSQYTVDMTSDDFDTFVAYGQGRDCQGTLIDGNDDRDSTTTNSRMSFTARGGDYFILANSFDAGETGAYRLSVSQAGGSSAQASPSSGSTPRFTRPSNPQERYDFDALCSGVATVGLILLMETGLSDDALMAVLEENYDLGINAKTSGAALGKSEADIDEEIASYGAAIMLSEELMRDFPPVETRQACVDASRR